MIELTLMRSALTEIAKAADRLDVTSGEPKTYRDATDTMSLGYRMHPPIGSIKEDGKALELPIGKIEDGVVLRAGTPKYWVLSGDGRVLASAPVTIDRPLRIGVAWALADVKIRVEAP